MSVALGRFHSPGALARTDRYRARRRQVLETSEKTTGLKLRQVANQPNEGQKGLFRVGGAVQNVTDAMQDIVNKRPFEEAIATVSRSRAFGAGAAAPAAPSGGGGLFGGIKDIAGDIGGVVKRGLDISALSRGVIPAVETTTSTEPTTRLPVGDRVQVFDNEQKYIAKHTTPKFQAVFRATIGESLQAIGVSEELADKVANVAGVMLGQIVLPTSLVPFVGTGSRLVRVARAVTLGAGLGASQEAAFIREIEGRDPELYEILLAAGLGGAGAGIIESGAIGAGFRAARGGVGALAETPAAREALEFAAGEAGSAGGRRPRGIGEPDAESFGPQAFPEPEGGISRAEVAEAGTLPGIDPLPEGQQIVPGDPTAPQALPAARGVERDLPGAGLERLEGEGTLGVSQQGVRIEDITPVQGTQLDAQSQKLMPSERDLIADAAPIAGGDAGGLTRLELQTQRQVEARSKGVPLPVRKQQATEYLADTAADSQPNVAGDVTPPHKRRPKTWEEVEDRNAGRYFENLATKFDDMTAGLRGITNRAGQRVVRNVFVIRDILVHRESYKQVARFNAWIGRHQNLLGINVGKGTFDNISPKAGVEIPESMVQTPMSVYFHPDSYNISPEQAVALREMSDQFDINLKYTQAAGQDVESISDPLKYWPQAVKDVPKGIDQKVWQPVQLARRPWFTHNRRFPDPHDGARAGIKYENGFRAAGARLTEGIESAANLEALTRIRRLTDLPSDLVPQDLSDALKLAQSDFQTARKAALKSGSLADKTAALEAQVALDNAKTAQRVAAERVAAKPKILGRVPKDSDIADEVMRYLEREPPQGWDEMFQIARGVMVTADDSSALIQNWNMFFTNTPAWLKSFGLSASAVKQAPYEFVADNIDLIERGIDLGFITPPTEFQLNRGGKLSQRIGEFPVIKQTQRVFEWNIFAGQTLRYKSLVNSGMTTDELLELASVTRRQAGQMFMPGLTDTQIKNMSRLWFAPQFFAGMTSAVTQPLELAVRASRGDPGAARATRESLKAMGTAFGGAAMFAQGANLYLHGELGNMDDPDKPGFWGIRMPDKVGGGFVFPMGPYQPLIVALTRTMKGDRTAIPKMLEGKMSLPLRWFTAMLEGLGVPLSAVRGDPFTRPGRTFTGRSKVDIAFDVIPLPIGISQVAQGLMQKTPITALEILGGRTTVETPNMELKRKFEEKHNREYDPSTDRVIALADPELAPIVRAKDRRSAERGSESGESRKKREAVISEQAQQLSPFIEGIRAGDPRAGAGFRGEFARFKTFAAGATADSVHGVDFGDAETEAEKLRGELREVIPAKFMGEDFEIDWDAYDAARDAVIDKLDKLRPGFRAAYEGQLRLPEEFQDVERQFLAARQLRDQLSEISPVQGLSADQWKQIQDFLREVNAQRMQWRLDPKVGDIPLEQAIAIVGRQQGKDRGFLNAANTLRGGVPDNLRNPEYDRFLLANAGTGQAPQGLFLFYPELFRRQSLQLGIAQGQGEPVFETAGAGRGRRQRRQRLSRR